MKAIAIILCLVGTVLCVAAQRPSRPPHAVPPPPISSPAPSPRPSAAPSPRPSPASPPRAPHSNPPDYLYPNPTAGHTTTPPCAIPSRNSDSPMQYRFDKNGKTVIITININH